MRRPRAAVRFAACRARRSPRRCLEPSSRRSTARSAGRTPSGRSSTDGVTTATAALEGSRRLRRGQIYVALAAVAWSTAGVLQRQLTLDTATQVFGRAAFAGIALLLYVALVERGRVVHGFRSIGLPGVAVAV